MKQFLAFSLHSEKNQHFSPTCEGSLIKTKYVDGVLYGIKSAEKSPEYTQAELTIQGLKCPFRKEYCFSITVIGNALLLNKAIFL